MQVLDFMIQYLNGDIVSGNTCIVSETVPVDAGAVFYLFVVSGREPISRQLPGKPISFKISSWRNTVSFLVKVPTARKTSFDIRL